MNLQQIEEWVTRLTQLGQADSPMEISGYIMTPSELLRHARANDNIWNQIKDVI